MVIYSLNCCWLTIFTKVNITNIATTCVWHTLNLISAWSEVQYSESMVGKSPSSWNNSTAEYLAASFSLKWFRILQIYSVDLDHEDSKLHLVTCNMSTAICGYIYIYNMSVIH